MFGLLNVCCLLKFMCGKHLLGLRSINYEKRRNIKIYYPELENYDNNFRSWGPLKTNLILAMYSKIWTVDEFMGILN